MPIYAIVKRILGDPQDRACIMSDLHLRLSLKWQSVKKLYHYPGKTMPKEFPDIFMGDFDLNRLNEYKNIPANDCGVARKKEKA